MIAIVGFVFFFFILVIFCRFDQLESGAYPSFRAVGLMLAEGIDIEAIRLSSPDDSGIERVRDRFLVWEQFHVTNPFRQLLLAV